MYYSMEYLQGKHFSVTDPKNINTVIYEINKTEKSNNKSVGDNYEKTSSRISRKTKRRKINNI